MTRRGKLTSMKKVFLLLGLCFLSAHVIAQKSVADSLARLLATEKTDTNRVKLMWQQADASKNYDPEKALIMASRALILAERIKYLAGQSSSLKIMANTFQRLGNYPRALDYNFKKLKLDEKIDIPLSLASDLMNIGIVYAYMEEYQKALDYYYRSDSMIRRYDIGYLKYFSAQNLGDVYDRLNIPDSAFFYFNRAIELAKAIKNDDFTGSSMTGLGHTYLKQKNYMLAQSYYLSAIIYLKASNDDDNLCEATLGLAKLYKETKQKDSAIYYSRMSHTLAQGAGFLSRDLDASEFLTTQFKELKNIDSAFLYMNYVQVLNDSVNSKSRIREAQVLSINEQLRQIELEENRKTVQRERVQQLQLLFIGIFIPGFFLFTLLLSRIRIHVRVIKILGIISLLILFEYLTLLLHPYVAELTNHKPVIEMLIFVSIAAILIPTHHRVEHWLIKRLVSDKNIAGQGRLKLKKQRIKMKNPDTEPGPDSIA